MRGIDCDVSTARIFLQPDRDSRYRFGQGYFDYPMPSIVGKLRERSYPPLARIASSLERSLGREGAIPGELELVFGG